MDTGSRGQELGIEDEVIKKACSVSVRAHQARDKPFLVEKIGRRSPSQVVFAFSGSWSFDEWSAGDGKARAFGETQVNLATFPSLRSIGNDITATVNASFMRQFLQIAEGSTFLAEVEKAMGKSTPIIFAGHSSGGPIAIYATIWLLEEHKRSKKAPTHGPFCLTFGSPLTTDRIFCHAVRREEWSDRFVHFVTLLDIVPRILLAPLGSTKDFLEQILPSCLISTSARRAADSIDKVKLTALFATVMRNASCVASHAACILMGSTNMLLDTMTKFVELSPYRPCGKYVFCAGPGKPVVVKNPDAVFQLLFYSLQLLPESDVQQTAVASLMAHLAYEDALDKSLDMKNAVHLENLRELPLGSDDTADMATKAIDATLNGLNLSARARLCLRAAGESEKQKEDNQTKVEHKMATIERCLSEVEGYRTMCETRGMGYFDAFKVQKYEDDFRANVKRLELSGIWDEIIEMLKRDELPDRFEAEETWVNLGTRFRQLVEPLDVANYYRHLKNEDTGSYMTKGRPRRYKYTQRWREHAGQLPKGASGESCFWAEVEELNLATADNRPANEPVALELAKKLKEWHDKGEVKKDAFLKETALAKWWRTLPDNYEAKSCLEGLMET